MKYQADFSKNIFTVPILIFLIKTLQSLFEIFIQKVDILTKQLIIYLN